MITVWGRKNSVNVQKALWALAELGKPFERQDVGGAFGGLDTPEYVAMNPNKRIPTLVDNDGTVIWESNAIVRYLCARYRVSTLWPDDPVARGHADMWMDWQVTTILPDMFTTFWGLVRTPAEKRDMPAIEAAAERMGQSWSHLDNWLSDKPYVAGDSFSMGDIPVGCFVWRYSQLDIVRPSLPNLDAWHNRLQTRKGFQEHVMQPLS